MYPCDPPHVKGAIKRNVNEQYYRHKILSVFSQKKVLYPKGLTGVAWVQIILERIKEREKVTRIEYDYKIFNDTKSGANHENY